MAQGWTWPGFRTGADAVDQAMKRLQGLLGRTPVYTPDRLVSAATTATTADGTLLVDTTAAGVTVTLPLGKPNRGRAWVVVHVAGANNVTVQGTGGETVNGGASLVWNTANLGHIFQAVQTAAPDTHGYVVY